MSIIIKIVVIVLITIAIMFFTKKFVESIFNLKVFFNRNNHYDVSNQKNGIVLNKKKKKLEADQSIILPF